MSLPADPIPAPGFTMISGTRNPPNDGSKYEVQFANGFVDRKHQYSAPHMRWKHNDPLEVWDVVAVRKL